jgi:hypothetical protein
LDFVVALDVVSRPPQKFQRSDGDAVGSAGGATEAPMTTATGDGDGIADDPAVR